MNARQCEATWEAMCDMASEYITKKRYAMGVGLLVGFLCGYPF